MFIIEVGIVVSYISPEFKEIDFEFGAKDEG
jgi:hypothetical protein